MHGIHAGGAEKRMVPTSRGLIRGHSCCLWPGVPSTKGPTFLPHWKGGGNFMWNCRKAKAERRKQCLSHHNCRSPGFGCVLGSPVCSALGLSQSWYQREGVYVLNILCPVWPESRALGHVFLYTLGPSFASIAGCGLGPARSKVSFTQGIRT